ncbi:MAG: type I methionyl aminopeptidase [bacterium]
MIIVKSPEEIGRMRKSGLIAAEVRDRVVKRVAPGITTKELDEYAAEIIAASGARSAFLGYKGSRSVCPYPGNICLSINDEVVHGIPAKRRVEVGDIVSIDVGVQFEGYFGDTATTVMVGVSDFDVIRLVAVTEEALKAGIEKARAGNRLYDISHAIESVAVKAGFSVVRDFVGHGVGKALHEDPQVPNFGQAGRGVTLRTGMTLALEPMINMGGAAVEVMGDGWTVRTVDRKPSAHFEHTVAVQDGAAEILT